MAPIEIDDYDTAYKILENKLVWNYNQSLQDPIAL